MLCFNIAEPESLHNAAAKWYREVRTHGGSAPVLLCGCKADLRHEKETLTMLSKLRTHPVTSEEVTPDKYYITESIKFDILMYTNKS
ncbi:hypothetical protein B5X24_HaOG215534 [Helicoverpa armigera]|uniref:Uncharacterized protein n=1 Tax=Helicoverpa armigera TaxID=29058 RepID=A0A2W1B047_HELAM|nr:hypothetical protein B5X24_HaOG215534 [Helicoverpa armigera]